MKSLLAIAVFILVLIGQAFTQTQDSQTKKEMDEYCISTSRMADQFDARIKEIEWAAPHLALEDTRRQMLIYAAREKQLVKIIRWDACYASYPIRKSETKKDTEKLILLNSELMEYTKQAIAENQRMKRALQEAGKN